MKFVKPASNANRLKIDSTSSLQGDDIGSNETQKKTIIQLISKHMSFTSATLLAFKEFKSVKSSQMIANKQ